MSIFTPPLVATVINSVDPTSLLHFKMFGYAPAKFVGKYYCNPVDFAQHGNTTVITHAQHTKACQRNRSTMPNSGSRPISVSYKWFSAELEGIPLRNDFGIWEFFFFLQKTVHGIQQPFLLNVSFTFLTKKIRVRILIFTIKTGCWDVCHPHTSYVYTTLCCCNLHYISQKTSIYILIAFRCSDLFCDTSCKPGSDGYLIIYIVKWIVCELLPASACYSVTCNINTLYCYFSYLINICYY